jgi:succinoglycan biosynthesis protein ExoO
MKSDTIAVVIPVYNKEAYVGRAIESVLHQTSPVDEIIIVDDGSTDGSVQRVQAYDDPRIRLLGRERPGPGGYLARNLAIHSTNVQWIAFLDADDEWHPDFVEEIRKAIDRAPENIGCVFTGWENIWPDGTITRDAYSANSLINSFTQLDLDTFISSWLKVHLCPIWTSAVAVRRDVLLAAGLFPERCKRGGDKDTWLRVMAVTEALASSKACSRYHRQTVNQVTSITTNSRHCLCPTLEKMAIKASGQRHRLLMRLFNSEVFDYAIYVGQNERVLPEIYRGFHVSLNPARYCVLLALSYLPIPVQRFIRSLILRFVRPSAGRRPSGKPNRRDLRQADPTGPLSTRRLPP